MAEKFRILAADKLAPEGLDFIRAQPDVELTNKPGPDEDELAAMIGDFDGVIVRSGVQVTAKVLANPGRLKAVARAGVGVDNIDLDAATARGILVLNSAEASTVSTCEHAFALMMALARNIGPAYRTMVEGGWDRSSFVGTQLAGKTLGVVGFGRIGRAMAERALAFGMDVVAYDPFYSESTALDGKVRVFGEFVDMLPHADILTFHVPLNDATRGMLNADTFPRCRDHVLVINAARGGVVDEQALVEAIDAGKCAGAAIDVYPEEPPPADSPLRRHPKVLTTPHLGASTREGQQAVSIGAAESLLAFLRGEGIRGAVNLVGVRFDLDPIQERFVDLASRMASIISPMITRGIAQVTFEHQGKQLVSAASTIERTGLVGLLGSGSDVPLNVISVTHEAESRGIKTRTVTSEEAAYGPQLVMEIRGPSGAIDKDTHPADRTRRIVGRVYEDMRPRIVEINGYHMDMVPEGSMLLIQNEDRPGMVGMVGAELGQAEVNIADMAISRRDDTALMVLKLDGEPDGSVINRLKARPGILKTAMVKLPPLP
jgi:D-3-phosphoglycerate dehydrogenase